MFKHMDDIRNACPISWKLRTTILAIVHRFHWSAFSLSSFSFSNHVSVNDRILFIHPNLFFCYCDIVTQGNIPTDYLYWMFSTVSVLSSRSFLSPMLFPTIHTYTVSSLSHARVGVCVYGVDSQKKIRFYSSFFLLFFI